MSDWVVGIKQMRGEVSEGYRPEVVVVLDADSRFVLATELAKPGQALVVAARVVGAALAKAPNPARIRVANAKLRDALRAVGDVEIVVGKTTEANEVFTSLEQFLDRSSQPVETYLQEGIAAEALAPFFTAAARFFRAKPWTVTPIDECVAITCDALGIRDGRLVVVGQLEQNFGLSLYPDRAAYEQVTMHEGEDVPFPPQLVLTFDTRAGIGKARADEVRRRRWALAGPSAYPHALRVDSRDEIYELNENELVAFTAVIDTVARLVEATPRLARCWIDSPPVRIEAAGVAIVAPAPLANEVPYDPHEPELASVLRTPLLDDDARRDRYLEAIKEAFERSPEAKPIETTWANMFTELVVSVTGKTLAELGPDETRELLFGYVPRQVSVAANEAPAIVASVRALLGFVARELGGYGPNLALAQLVPASEEWLADELGNSDNFGMAKQLVMQAIEAGYDLENPADVAAYVASVNAKVPKKKRPAAKRKRR